MFEPEGRQVIDVFGFNVIAFGYELVQGGVHIDSIPKHYEIDYQAKHAELIFLTLAITLVQFSTLPMRDSPGELAAENMLPDASSFSRKLTKGYRLPA